MIMKELLLHCLELCEGQNWVPGYVDSINGDFGNACSARGVSTKRTKFQLLIGILCTRICECFLPYIQVLNTICYNMHQHVENENEKTSRSYKILYADKSRICAHKVVYVHLLSKVRS